MHSHVSPARSYFAFVLILLAAMLCAAITSPWVVALLRPVGEFPLHRVFSRLMLVGMIGGTIWLVYRQHHDCRSLLGFDRPWPLFLRRVLWGLAAGLALMTLAALPLVLLGVREWNDRLLAEASGWVQLALKGLGSGIAVALLEETFFRGAMQGALQRLGGTIWALLAVPVLYSAVHFLGRGSVPADQVNAWSGFVVWQGSFSAFAHPLAILDAFMTLYLVGLLLALVRYYWGDIAGCMGLHAGFVAVIAVFRRISTPNLDSHWSFLVGAFDGLLGMWVAALTALACLALWRLRRNALP